MKFLTCYRYIYATYVCIELAHTIAVETRQFDNQREALTHQLQDAQEELAEIQHTRHSHDQRVHELDELTRQLLHLNDALVAKLSHSGQANTSLRKILGITKKVHIPAPTESVKARHRSPVRTKDEISVKEKELFGDDEIENLQALHDMYKGLAKSLIETRPSTISGFKGSMKKDAKSSRQSKSVAFLTTVGLSPKPTNSAKTPILQHTQQQFYRSNQSQNSDPAYDSDGADSALAIAEDLRSASLDRSNREFPSLSLGLPRSPVEVVERQQHRTSSSPSPLRGSNSLQTLHFEPVKASPAGDTNKHHVEKVIQSLEDEFEFLTTQYKQILATMQKDPEVSRPGLPESSLRNSEQLISVIQQLQRKGEQLRELRALKG